MKSTASASIVPHDSPLPQYSPPQDPPPRTLVLESMTGSPGLGGAMEALLKRPGSAVREFMDGKRPGALSLSLILIALGGLALFGVAAMDFSKPTQWWAGPLKMIAGLALSGLLCLPSLYIFGCLSGLEIPSQDRGRAPAYVAESQRAPAGGLHPGGLGLQPEHRIPRVSRRHPYPSLGGGPVSRHEDAHRRSPGAGDDIQLPPAHLGHHVRPRHPADDLRSPPALGQADTFLPTEKKFFLEHWVDNMKPNDYAGPFLDQDGESRPPSTR